MSEITPAQKTALLKLEGFKEIQKQYAKESKMAGSGKRRMKGRGFWDDVGSWFRSVGTSINDFLKRTKLISNVAGAVLPLLAPMGTALLTANPIAAAASVGAAKAAAEGIKSLGYGSKKMKGGELSNKLVINPVGQRLMGKGIIQDVQYLVKGITGKGMAQRNDTFGMNGVQQQHTAPMKGGIMKTMKGNGPAQHYRLKAGPALKPKAMIGAGGIPYGSISSEFGNVKFT
jgi:hypothetical protein